jgi:hypothetical protein
MDSRNQPGEHSREDLIDLLAPLVAASHTSTLSEAEAQLLNSTLDGSKIAREIFLDMALDTQSLRVWATAQTRRDALSATATVDQEGALILPIDSSSDQLPPLEFDGYLSLDEPRVNTLLSLDEVANPTWLSRLFPSAASGASDYRAGSFVVIGLLLLAIVGVAIVGPRADSTASRPAVLSAHRPVEAFDARVVRVDSGSTRLTLPNVGYMLIDGPAEVELINPLCAKLRRGRIRVRVTESTGRGFVVKTPDGDVIDLSTEFGLEVAEGKKTGVVVFDGKVDLCPGHSNEAAALQTQRLVGGEGVLFDQSGELDRIFSIVTGQTATFLADFDGMAKDNSAVITKVSDNLPSSATKKFYEIVPGGLRDDTLAYGDRPEHQWNGMTRKGLPEFLIGADYVKTFSDDKQSEIEIELQISRPARLFIFFDDKWKSPPWLKEQFQKTKFKIGMDLGPWPTIGRTVSTAQGPGISIDHSFDIWECIISAPGKIKLGSNGDQYTGSERKGAKMPYMYGIAAVPLASGDTAAAARAPAQSMSEFVVAP